jgi:hypothetical protein
MEVGRGVNVKSPRNSDEFPSIPPELELDPLTSAQKCAIIGMVDGVIPKDPLTNPAKMGYNGRHDGECNSPSAVKRTNF